MDQEALKHLYILDILLDNISKKCSSPVNYTEGDILLYLEQARHNPFITNEFFCVGSVTSPNIKYSLNTGVHIGLEAPFSSHDYMALIHPDFVISYLKWGRAIYAAVDQCAVEGLVIPQKTFFKIIFPLKYADGRFYWTLLEASPLQVDINNNMLTHLNKYTKLVAYKKTTQIELKYEIDCPDLTLSKDMIGKLYFELLNGSRHKLNQQDLTQLTYSESEIMNIIWKTPKVTLKEIGAKLDKAENTVKNQCKKILEKARNTFPGQTFKNIKDVVNYLVYHSNIEIFLEKRLV